MNNRPLTPKSMPPTNDEHAKRKAYFLVVSCHTGPRVDENPRPYPRRPQSHSRGPRLVGEVASVHITVNLTMKTNKILDGYRI